MTDVQLKAKRADVLKSYAHPWVFSKGLLQRPKLEPGSLVQVGDQTGNHLGWAFYHPENPIALRMVSLAEEQPNEDFWRKQLQQALAIRKLVLPPERSSFRLIHGENDGFPGLTIDIFDRLACMQVNSAGFEKLKGFLAHELMSLLELEAVYERSEGHARQREGLPPAQGFLAGSMSFPIQIKEADLIFSVDPSQDQKTGFFLDQYEQRRWVAAHAKGKRVLDLCCYSGGFTYAAMRAGAAKVQSVDSSQRALELLDNGLTINRLDRGRHRAIQANVFEYLKQPPKEKFDLVILDPPALAKTVKTIDNARKGYRRLNKEVANWVKPGGLLLTFSCSGVITTEVFKQSVFLGLRDAQRKGIVVKNLEAGSDHPVDLCFPEGAYLKGFVLYLP